MLYCGTDDIRRRIGDFVGLYDINEQSCDELMQDDIAAVSARIDYAIGQRYQLPLAAPGELLKDWALTLIEEKAWNHSNQSEIPKKVADRIAEVKQQLTDIADGKRKLAGETEISPTLVDLDINDPEFTRSKMKGY